MEDQKAQFITDKSNYEQALFLQDMEHSVNLKKLIEEFEEGMIMNRCKEDKLKCDITCLQNEIEILKQEHRQDVAKLEDDYDKVEKALQEVIEDQRKSLEAKLAELSVKEQELSVFQKECIDLQREHALEIEKIRKAHQLEIQDIEFEFLKTMTKLQNEKDVVLRKCVELQEKARGEIEQMQQFFNNEKLVILNGSEQKMNEVSFVFNDV